MKFTKLTEKKNSKGDVFSCPVILVCCTVGREITRLFCHRTRLKELGCLTSTT